MTDRIAAGGLQVDSELYDFINDEALPGTGVTSEAFWAGFDRLVHGLAPRNRELLDKREELQRRIDAWYRENHDEPIDLEEYKNVLREIGYLVPEGDDFSARTANVDPEISTVAGPQLVVPVTNARYALNAANRPLGQPVRRALRHRHDPGGRRLRAYRRLQPGPRRARDRVGARFPSIRRHRSPAGAMRTRRNTRWRTAHSW